MKLKSLLLCGLAAVAFSGCQEDNLGFSARQIFDAAYKRNLEEKIGTIDPNQSWDFSHITRSFTREEYVPIETDENGYYHVQNSTLDWMKEYLPEDTNNSDKASSFNLRWEDGLVFEIVPIYQGLGGLHWEMHMKVGTEDRVIWSKSEGIKHVPQCPTCKGTGKATLCEACTEDFKHEKCSDQDDCPHVYEGYDGYIAWNYYVRCESTDPGAIKCHVGTGDEKECRICGAVHASDSSEGANYVRLCPICGGGNQLPCSVCKGIGYTAEGADTTCPDCNGTGAKTEDGEMVWQELSELGISNDANTLNSKAVMAKPIITTELFKDENGNAIDFEAGTPIQFYLKVTGPEFTGWGKPGDWDDYQLNHYYAPMGYQQQSDNNMISIVDCPHPTNIPQNYKSYIVGVEDSHLMGTDWDYNDVVFLVTGYVPDIVYTEHPTVETVSKRYLIEDLTGKDFDFDFNDIVVDVTQTTTTHWKEYEENGQKKYILDNQYSPNPEVKQEATIRWICGTIPFQVQVGNTKFGCVSDPMNPQQTSAELMSEQASEFKTEEFDADQKNPGYQPMFGRGTCTKQIEGWDPAANNISVVIYWDGSTVTSDPNAAWINTFPERGSVPFMIATDITEEPNWMDEGVDITESEWWQNNYVATHLPVADVK